MPSPPLLSSALFVICVSGAALLTAYLYFESHLALEACTLCWWQRYAHMVALGAGVLASANLLSAPQIRPRVVWVLLFVATLALASATGIALWHTLTEAGVIPLLVCETPALDLSESGRAFSQILERKPVRCDVAPWTFLGLSIAGWNFVYSGLATGGLVFLLLRARRARQKRGDAQ